MLVARARWRCAAIASSCWLESRSFVHSVETDHEASCVDNIDTRR